MQNLSDIIYNKQRPFQINESVEEVLEFFDENPYSHYPVLDGNVYMGSLSSDDAYTLDISKKIADYRYLLEPFFVRNSSNWFEVLEKLSQNNSDVIPVLNHSNEYVGVYFIENIIELLKDTPFVKEQGTTVVLERLASKYTLSEIVQIAEENRLNILGLFVSNAQDLVQIFLKVSTGGNINEMLQSFRRYEYTIISEHTEDNYLQILKDRSDYLDKYLNI